jgi:hypothetical protein
MQPPYLINGVFSDLMTSFVEERRRLKVDVGSTAYEDGREFRAYYDFTKLPIPAVLKFVITRNIDLTTSMQEIRKGGMRYRVFLGGVEGGTFSALNTVFSKNSKTGSPVTSAGVTIFTGGTLDVTGIDPIDISYVGASGEVGQTVAVSTNENQPRGFPPTTAYIIIDSDRLPGVAEDPSGIIKYEWTVEK